MIRVLYIDDDPAALEVGRHFLEKSSEIEVIAEISASNVLERIFTGDFDVVISDYQMSGMDGLELLRRLRSNGNSIPFIIFTGRGREEVAIQALNEGADFYLQKGGELKVQFAELRHMISRSVSRKRAQDALQESEEKYRTLVEHCQDGVFLIQDEKLLFINPAFSEIIGYLPEEMCGADFWTFIAPDDRAMVRERYLERLAGRNVPDAYEFSLLHKDGGAAVTINMSVGIVNFQGRSAHIGTVRNITEKKKEEKARRESEERYIRLLENSFDAVAIHQDGVIIDGNEKAAELVGAKNREELIGRKVLDVVHTDFLDVVKSRIRLMTERQDVAMPLIEEKFNRMDGTAVDVEVMATGFVHNGRPAMQVVFRDITQRKAAEEALKESNRKLRLLSSITRHDIQNQIHLLAGYLEMTRERLDGNEVCENYLDIMNKSLEKIRNQIMFTRDYEQVGAGRPVWVNISATVSAAAGKNGLSGLTLDLQTGNLEIYSDQLIEKVFSNLFDNSVMHGRHATSIRLFAEEKDGSLILVYEDDGSGIPHDQKELIFERGFGKNSGLGLFLAREVLGITGIDILECGDPGKGARFEMSVPADRYRFFENQ